MGRKWSWESHSSMSPANSACFLISKREWMVGMGGGNACGFWVPSRNLPGSPISFNESLGVASKKSRRVLMAPHWTGSPPLITHHTAFMNPKWEAVHDSLFLSHRFKHPVFVPLSPQSSRYKHSCSSHSHRFTYLLLWTRKQKDYSSYYVTINLESLQEQQTCKLWSAACRRVSHDVNMCWASLHCENNLQVTKKGTFHQNNILRRQLMSERLAASRTVTAPPNEQFT